MLNSRRTVIVAVLFAAARTGLAPLRLNALQSPQPRPSPNAPINQNAPAGLDSTEIIHPDNQTQPNTLNQEQIVAQVNELYKLAGELKDQADHADLRSTFPVTFVKKAQQIEKLAKQIKEKAKG